jgi:Ran GTPase-activating protein (RanGAP) involved in mRNA processing and transport
MFFSSTLGRRAPAPPVELEYHTLIYEFHNLDREREDEEPPSLWDQYCTRCFSLDPPIPALALMRPILYGDQTTALFAHQQVSMHLPVILDLIGRSKVVTELDLTDNSLTPDIVQPLVDFILDGDQLAILKLDDNPQIGPKAMQRLVEGIKDNRGLEIVSFANTGSNCSVGHYIALFIQSCSSLIRLNVSHCLLRGSAIEMAQSLPSSTTLKHLNLAKNELFYGGRKLALQLRSNVAKCSTLSRLDLSQNSLSSEMVMSLLRGLGDATGLHHLNLSKNEIGETAGRAMAQFIQKSTGIRELDISMNPLLNVTANKIEGQLRLEEENQKPGGGNKKSKKKVYVPGCYLIVAALAKSTSLRRITMQGLLVDLAEWRSKLEVLTNAVQVVYMSPDAERYNFRPRTAPVIVKPATPRSSRRGNPVSARRT